MAVAMGQRSQRHSAKGSAVNRRPRFKGQRSSLPLSLSLSLCRCLSVVLHPYAETTIRGTCKRGTAKKGLSPSLFLSLSSKSLLSSIDSSSWSRSVFCFWWRLLSWRRTDIHPELLEAVAGQWDLVTTPTTTHNHNPSLRLESTLSPLTSQTKNSKVKQFHAHRRFDR